MRDLAARISEARAAWPGVELDRSEFEAYIAERGTEDDELCEVDLWLAAACAKGDSKAIALFDARYIQQLGAALAPMRLSRDAIDEVAQELRRKLLVSENGEPPRIIDYSGRADLRTWVRTVAVRAALDQMRKQRDVPVEDETLAAAMPALDDDPELIHIRGQYQAELKAAFAAGINDLEPRDRALLKYTYVDGLSIDQIGALYGVHRATAARWIAVARDRLGKLVDRALRDKLRVTDSDRASIARLVESQIDFSVRRLLG